MAASGGSGATGGCPPARPLVLGRVWGRPSGAVGGRWVCGSRLGAIVGSVAIVETSATEGCISGVRRVAVRGCVLACRRRGGHRGVGPRRVGRSSLRGRHGATGGRDGGRPDGRPWRGTGAAWRGGAGQGQGRDPLGGGLLTGLWEGGGG